MDMQSMHSKVVMRGFEFYAASVSDQMSEL